MRIHLAADHAGFELKEKVKDFLLKEGYEIEDHGAKELDQADDYPDFIQPAAKAVSENKEDKAIIFGGSGQGEAMVANRFPRVRAAIYYGPPQDLLRLSREHNDANILSIAARFLKEAEALEAISIWLETPFSKEERHRRRIAKF